MVIGGEVKVVVMGLTLVIFGEGNMGNCIDGIRQQK